MTIKKIKQSKPKSHVQNTLNQMYELPSLDLTISESSADYVTQNLNLHVRSYNMQECISAMEYLLSRAKDIKNKRQTK